MPDAARLPLHGVCVLELLSIAARRRTLPLMLAGVAASMLSACASTFVQATGDAPPLLSPASLGATVQAQQVLHAAYGKDEHSLQCVVSDDTKTLSLICLTATGQRLFTLDYDGANLKAWRAPYAPDRIDPAHIIADLQLAFWPLAPLQAAWQPRGYEIVEPRPGLRRMIRDGRIVTEVHSAQPGAWPARLWLVNLAYGYSLDIETALQTDVQAAVQTP